MRLNELQSIKIIFIQSIKIILFQFLSVLNNDQIYNIYIFLNLF